VLQQIIRGDVGHTVVSMPDVLATIGPQPMPDREQEIAVVSGLQPGTEERRSAKINTLANRSETQG
jgi:hypothetical protein